MSKTCDKENPMCRKMVNPNYEPWLTYCELIEETKAIAVGYKRRIQNGSIKEE